MSVDPVESAVRATILLDEDYIARDREEKAKLRRMVWLLALGLAFVLVISGIQLFVLATKSETTASGVASNTRNAKVAKGVAKTAKTAAATAKTAATKARGETAKNTKDLKTVARVQHTQTRVLIEKGILKRGPRGLQGGPGPIGLTGPTGKFPFTLAEIVDNVSPRLVSEVKDRLDARLPAALLGVCGGSCNGSNGADGKDVTQAMVDDGLRRILPGIVADALTQNCGGSCKGDPGVPGADSTVPGPAGADSTVPGPQGPAGPVNPCPTLPPELFFACVVP
jgi:hypothetical protein